MVHTISYHITPYAANQYSSLFSSLNQKVDQLYDHLNNDFLVTTNKVKKYTSTAREKMVSGKTREAVHAKIKYAVKRFDSIIVELQYHDIIRQKLEHIYTVEKKISEEFAFIYENPESRKSPYFVLIMHEVIELSINQLKAIKDDYLFASTKIQQILRSLWADREISRELQLFLFNTAENLRNVIQALDVLIKMHERIRDERIAFEVRITDEHKIKLLNEIKQLYTMESEREVFNKTFSIVEEPAAAVEDDIFF